MITKEAQELLEETEDNRKNLENFYNELTDSIDELSVNELKSYLLKISIEKSIYQKDFDYAFLFSGFTEESKHEEKLIKEATKINLELFDRIIELVGEQLNK